MTIDHRHDDKVVMLGPPGSGKGTHAVQLAQRLSVPHISTGALLRDEIAARTRLGRQVADAVRSGLFVTDEAIVELIEQRIDSRTDVDGWILDGAPRTLSQAELLAPLIEGDDPAIVIALDVDNDELRRRLGRRRTDEQRADDDPGVVEDRLVLWADTGPQLLDRYARLGLLVLVDGSAGVGRRRGCHRPSLGERERGLSAAARTVQREQGGTAVASA